MSRTKKTIITSVSREEAEEALAAYATADAREKSITATMDEQITKIREQHQEELSQIATDKASQLDYLQRFAETNPDDFGKRRSLEMVHGLIGFRTGQPKLKTLKGITWTAATLLIKKFMPDYIRTIEEPMKDRLLADRDKEGMTRQMTEVGIQVVQDETFYIDLKKETAVATK